MPAQSKVAWIVTKLTQNMTLISGYHHYLDIGKSYVPDSVVAYQKFYSLEAIRAAFAEILAPLKGVLLATTPTYLTQYLGGCLLREFGFRRAGSACYWNYNYPQTPRTDASHPGIQEHTGNHWIHLWYKQAEILEKFGSPVLLSDSLACCGAWLSGEIAEVAGLRICVLPTSTKLPVGWRRFLRFPDYKLVHNFDLIDGQKCPHKFDFSEFTTK